MGQGVSRRLATRLTQRSGSMAADLTPTQPQSSPQSSRAAAAAAAAKAKDTQQEAFIESSKQQIASSSAFKAEVMTNEPPPRPLQPSSSSTTSGQSHDELPEDLLNFLKDIGPLERQVDREFTSKRLLEEQDEATIVKSASTDRHRQIRKMPIMGNEMDFTATRTTNFSLDTQARQGEKLDQGQVDEDAIGMEIEEFYHLLNEGNVEKSIVAESTLSQDDCKAAEKRRRRLQSDVQKYLDIPIILKDTDGTFVGAFPERVDTLLAMQLKRVDSSNSSVRLVLAALANKQENDQGSTK